MAHTLTIEIPNEVYEEIRQEAQASNTSPEEVTAHWLKERSRSGRTDRLSQILQGEHFEGEELSEDEARLLAYFLMGQEDALKRHLLKMAQERFARLPFDLLPELAESAPLEEMPLEELISRIQAYDLILEIASLSEEELALLNQSLDEVIAAINRVIKRVDAALEKAAERAEAA